jgi:hypothetical protein
MKSAATLMMGVALSAFVTASAQSQNQPTSATPQFPNDVAAAGTANAPRSAVVPTAPAPEGSKIEGAQSPSPALPTGTAAKGASDIAR